MFTRYSNAAGAAIVLMTALCVSPAVLADDRDGSVVVCDTGKDVVIRASGHPGKSLSLPRREPTDVAQCSARAASKLVLVSFTDFTGGEALTTGKVDRAIRELSRNAGKNPSLALNNLCVAHTALGQWEEAQDACDAAVAAAADNLAIHGRWPGEQRRLANKVAAAVYSNRAVMHAMSSDAVAAQGDFARARAMAPKAAFVNRNAELAARLPARVDYGNLPVAIHSAG
jgi:hypothetical protein